MTAAVTPGVQATKAMTTSPFVVGLPANYTVTWRNTGNVDLNSPTLVDTLPAGVTCADVSNVSNTSPAPGTAPACTDATPNSTITWTMAGPAAPSQTANFTQTFTVTYPPAAFPAGTPITNSVTATGIPLGTTTPISNTAQVSNTPTGPNAVFVVRKSQSAASVFLGQPVTYTVSLQNTGNVPLSPVTLVDTLPVGLTCSSAGSSSGVSSISGGGVCNDTTTPSTVTWTSSTPLAPNATFQQTVTVIYRNPPFSNNQVVTNTVNGSATAPVTGQPATGNPSTGSVNTTLVTPAAGNITMAKTSTTPAGQWIVGQPVTYQVSVTNGGQPGSGPLTNFTVTDPLPAGLTCANVRSISNAGSCSSATTPNQVTWTFASLGAGATQTMTFTVVFPSPPFSAGNSISNCATGTGTYQGATTNLGPACTSNTLLAPNPSATISKVTSPPGTTTIPVGGNGTYVVTAQNNGNIPLTSMLVTDTLPTNMQPAPNAAPNVTFTDTVGLAASDVFEYFDSTTQQWVSVPNNSGAPYNRTCGNGTCTLTIPTTATQVRVTLTGTRPPNFAGGTSNTIPGFQLTLILQVPPSSVSGSGVPITAGDPIVNCATVGATELAAPAGPACTNQTVTAPTPTMTLTKTRTSPSPVPPPSPVSWNLVLGAPATSLAPIVNPTVTDCLPQGLDLVDPANPSDPANGSPPPNFTPAPTITRVSPPNACGANSVEVVWSWAGSVPALSIAPGQSGTFTLNTVLQPGTPPSTLTNSASAIAENHPTPTPNATATVVVAQGASLDSIKLIKGSLDTSYSKYPTVGKTTFAGSADYRMQITNSGNVPIDNITAIDILPFVGDTAVLNTADPRGSQWSPVLTGPVTAPAGVTVLYSTSTDPCRPELNYNPPGCQTGTFQPAPPNGDYSLVRSLEFQYAGPLAPGDSLQIDWPMVAPADVIPGQVAWNSFGYTGFRTDNGAQLTPAEPNKVGIEILPYPLQIQKLVNGSHEPNPPGLYIPTGQTVTYSYLVTNPGDLPVTNLNLFDNPAQNITCDVGGVPTPPSQVTIPPHTTLTCTADAGPAVSGGPHSDTACVTGQPVVNGTPGTTTDQVCDNANYFGASPGISLTKLVNGQHEPTAPGPFIPAGSPVTFTYVIQNTGNVTLNPVTLFDDKLGDITNCLPAPLPTSLAPGAVLTCTAPSTAVAGQQTNTATVTGQPVDNNGLPVGPPLTDTDVGNYFGASPGIGLTKVVNGQHEPTPPGLSVPVGTPITFTYVITNTGNVTLTAISLVDSVLGPIPTTACTPETTTLAPGDMITCTVSGGNAAVGLHTNVATVTGQGVDSSGNNVGPPQTATDVANYTATKAAPTVATTQNPASGPAGTPISDTATVNGGFSPTGFITFNLFGPGDDACSTVINTVTIPLSGTPPSATSAPPFPTTTVGTYHWVAIYSGDGNNAPAESGCAAEPVVIMRAAPTIATVASAGGPVGTEIFDTATVSGGFNPTGSVTFQLFGPGDPTCQGPAIFTDRNVPLVAPTVRSSATTSSVTSAPGTYHWIATYNGDQNNLPISSLCTEEPVVIEQATSAVLTTAPSPSGVVGTAISDTATVTGGFVPPGGSLGGTVTFQLFGPNDATCSGPNLVANTPGFAGVPLVNGSAGSPSFPTTTAGTYRWVASWTGDATNAPIPPTDCQEELVVLNRATPSISTTQSAGGPVGTVISDVATVNGGFNPTGSVTFELFGPGDATCTGPPVDVFANVPLGGGPPPTATSPGFTTTAVGTYRWIAIYSGDPNNEPISSLCQEEPVTTTRAAPTISTTQSPGGVVGTSISDTATVSGGDNPTGSDSFELFGPGDDNCSGPAVFVRIVPLTGTTATSPSFTTTAAGTYHWIAVYLGDTNNQPASSGCQDEPVVTTQASPTISTTPSPGGEVGTSLSDLATLTGAFNPTGHITFELFGPDDPTCQLKPVFTSTVSLQGIGATSGSFPTTTVGTYRWIDIYSGDDNNASVSSGCQDEPVTTTQAKPVLGTTPSPGGVVGAKISDLATVSGGFDPTGSVTFQLFGPDDPTCTGTPVHTFTDIPLSGGPPSAASGSFATITAGTYRWIGIYSGDDDNASVSSGCQEEPVTVDKASPAVVTVPSSGGPAGTAISDSAVLVRASSDPTGTVSFSLFGPGDPHCTTDLVHGSAAFKDLPFTSPKVVSGSFTPTTSGTYQWVVTYSGDANNNTAGGSCGDPTEQVAITAGPGPRPGPGPGPAPGPGVTAPPSIPGLPSTGYRGGGWPLLLAGPLVAGLGGLLLLVGRRRRKRGRAG